MSAARHTTVSTALGELTLVTREGANGRGLSGLFFEEHWHLPKPAVFGERVEAGRDPLFEHTVSELEEYLAGTRREFTVPLATAGSEFQERIWSMLLELKFGATTTYGDLAERIGNRKLARRVGQAVGWNPVSVFIPCHRVLGSNGALRGYAGGLERKERLLTIEGVLSAPII